MNESLDKEVKVCLTINENDLDTELAIGAAYFHRFSSLALDAELIYLKKELELETYEVNLAKAAKAILVQGRPKSYVVSEAEIKRSFREDDKWRKLKIELLEAQANYKKIEKIAKSFEMKSQNCMSLNKRQLFKASKGMIGVEDL